EHVCVYVEDLSGTGYPGPSSASGFAVLTWKVQSGRSAPLQRYLDRRYAVASLAAPTGHQSISGSSGRP
ncbi:MAG: hypothetical protein ACRDUA_01375, partial [Micromonosporaceae bacterium]